MNHQVLEVIHHAIEWAAVRVELLAVAVIVSAVIIIAIRRGTVVTCSTSESPAPTTATRINWVPHLRFKADIVKGENHAEQLVFGIWRPSLPGAKSCERLRCYSASASKLSADSTSAPTNRMID
jgi:hypothetical protein